MQFENVSKLRDKISHHSFSNEAHELVAMAASLIGTLADFCLDGCVSSFIFTNFFKRDWMKVFFLLLFSHATRQIALNLSFLETFWYRRRDAAERGASSRSGMQSFDHVTGCVGACTARLEYFLWNVKYLWSLVSFARIHHIYMSRSFWRSWD